MLGRPQVDSRLGLIGSTATIESIRERPVSKPLYYNTHIVVTIPGVSELIL